MSMLNALSTLALAPILITQGMYVRRVIPRLPEPDGAREGTVGQGKPLSVLVLGDSAAAGVGVASQQQALAGQLTAHLAENYQVKWRLTAKTGHTLAQVIDELDHLTDSHFDVVVLSVGVNDATTGTASKKWQDQYHHLLRILESRFKAKLILCSSVPPMHLFSALPQPLRWYMGQRAKKLNDTLKMMLNNPQAGRFMPIEFEVSPAYLAVDGFHPSDLAYSQWAKQLALHIHQNHFY